jgi:hypothetical protein
VPVEAELKERLSAIAGDACRATYREWFWRRANVKRFLRSLFFRSQYEGMAEWFEPALGETLQRISESSFKAGSGDDADGGQAKVNG